MEGKVYKNINKSVKLRKLEKCLARLQRKVSRKYTMNKEGESYRKTSNIVKLETKIRALRNRITNIRHDHLSKMTSKIVRTKPTHIVIEDLNVRGMMKNKLLSKAIQQCNFYEIRRQLEYKCKLWNVELVVANRWYVSSKTCSHCGTIKNNLKLRDRVFVVVV